jgi:hypothetical protein
MVGVLFLRVLAGVAVLVSAKVEAKDSSQTSGARSTQVEETPPALVDVDPSDGIDAREARAIAEAYFQQYSSIDCGGPGKAALHGRTWVFRLLFGATAQPTDERIRIDAKTGAISSDIGPRFRDLASFRGRDAGELILSGTISSITPEQGGLTPWIVRLDVAKVLLGNFSGGSFDFAVHSPARSGLQVGRTYAVKATRRGDGYAVDERQWRRSTKR